MEDVFSGLDALERDYLVGRMAEELPEIREKMLKQWMLLAVL